MLGGVLSPDFVWGYSQLSGSRTLHSLSTVAPNEDIATGGSLLLQGDKYICSN